MVRPFIYVVFAGSVWRLFQWVQFGKCCVKNQSLAHCLVNWIASCQKPVLLIGWSSLLAALQRQLSFVAFSNLMILWPKPVQEWCSAPQEKLQDWLPSKILKLSTYQLPKINDCLFTENRIHLSSLRKPFQQTIFERKVVWKKRIPPRHTYTNKFSRYFLCIFAHCCAFYMCFFNKNAFY